MRSKRKRCGFEAREALGNSYWNDPEWEKVKALRKAGKDAEANGLVFRIRDKYGL